MKKTCVFLAFFLLFATQIVVAQEPTQQSDGQRRIAGTGWAEEEATLIGVLAIRAKAIESVTGIKFGSEWKPKVSLEWTLGSSSGVQTAAEYKTETETIYLTIRTVYDLNVQYKGSVRLMDPAMLAKDDTLGMLLDHELGHALADIVSRRVSGVPFFTVKSFMALPPQAQFGLDIISEGVGTYFENVQIPSGVVASVMALPSTLEERSQYSYEMIANDGGYWLVRDVISKYGERGLAWLVTHPLYVNDSNMRKSVVEYREMALKELSQ